MNTDSDRKKDFQYHEYLKTFAITRFESYECMNLHRLISKHSSTTGSLRISPDTLIINTNYEHKRFFE